jgi:hypothetical protein
MKRLKLFEEFVSDLLEESQSFEFNQGNGSINWFTRDEINSIRKQSLSNGMGEVDSKCTSKDASYFGTPDGRGLAESVADFFTGRGDLCNTVCLKTESGDLVITKKNGVFSYTSEGNSGTSNNLSEILKNL